MDLAEVLGFCGEIYNYCATIFGYPTETNQAYVLL
jgi:hypothetical protein